jgi:thermitase
MNRKAIGILVLIMILISTLNLASFTWPVLAQKAKNDAAATDLLKGTNPEELVNNSANPQRLNGLNGDNSNVFQGEQKAKQESSTFQSSESRADRWNFNSTTEWSSYAYVNGTNTRLIVGLDVEKPASFLELQKMANSHQARIVSTISIKGRIIAIVVELSLASVASFVRDIRNIGLASYVEPNMKVQVQLVPNDPYWSLQWGPQKIEANSAWDTTVGNSSILVAVVDTGIDYNHPDLAANYVALGYDWVNMDPDPLDDCGHGTHCAGIIAAVLNNGLGIAGMAQVRIMAEKVLDQWGGGYWDWIADGIINATNCGAKIISMSLGGYGDSELLHDAIKYAYDNGVLVVAAAGNDNTNMKSYPAAYDEVIAVAATDQNDEKASFSNWGDWIELAAPGVSIYSTMPTYYVTLNSMGYSMNYDYLSGTSMACPHVAGVAALVWSRYPEKTRDWVRMWLRYTADDLGDPGFDTYYGYGRVNARKAVEQSPPAHDLIAYDWKTPPYVKPGALGVINATILNFGENGENDVTVQLLANGTPVANEATGSLAAGSSIQVSLTWNPTVEAVYNITLYVVPVPGETSVENNVLWKYIYVGFPVKAVVLHSAGNVYGEIITNWQTLNNEWYLFGGKMVYIDYQTLNKDDITYADIAATEADVLIISCAYDPYAGWQFTDSEIEAITEYVHEGHGLIATAGTFYYAVPNNNKLAPLFGLDESINWGSTGTDLLHLVDQTHPVLAGVPNPLVFPQVGTALPSDGRWDSNELKGGKYIALGHYRESAVVTCRGLVYISPWLEGVPPYYHHHLQLLYNAIVWSRYQKPQHELIVSVQVPNRINPGEFTRLNATVSNYGLSNETGVELRLFINGLPVETMAISQLLVGSSNTLSYLWAPTVQGAYNVTAYAPPILGEEFIENNVAKASVLVLLLAVRNALVYADDYAMPPSSRYVIVALDNLGINYTYYADDPSGFGAALVSQPWDLVVVDHCNYYSMGNYWNELDEYVRNGGLLVLSTFDIDGSDSQPTTLWDTLGVRWVSDMSSPEPVYRWNPSHPLFTFPNSIGDLTSYTEGYGDDGDHVATTTGTAVAGFTTQPANGYAGIVLGNIHQTILFSFILDEFRSDQNNDGRLDAVEQWENAIVYLARGYEHDLAVSLEAPSRLEPGVSTLLNVTIHNRGLNNETGIALQLMINGSIVYSELVPALLTGESYSFGYKWTPTAEAVYNLTAYAPPLPNEEVVANNVATRMVHVRVPLARVAVLGDYQSQLTDLLLENGFVASERGWDVISDIKDYDVVVINRPDDPGASTFLALLEAADLHRVGLVFTSSWPSSSAPYGISLLQWYCNDPEVQGDTYGAGSPYYRVAKDHPIFEGWKVNDTIYIITSGWKDHAWFSDYSGETIAEIGDDYGIRGGGIGYNIRANGNKHLLLAGLGPQYYANTAHWTEEAKLIFVRGVLWTSKPAEHELVVHLDAPDYVPPSSQALLNATVHNAGLNNETKVQLFLMLEGETVNSTMISQLNSGASVCITYAWRPTIKGVYNVTAYAPPIPGEDITWNNMATKSVTVQQPSIMPFEGQYADYALQWILSSTGEVESVDEWNFTYTHYVSPARINITLWTKTQGGDEQTNWMIVNIMDRHVESGLWAGMRYPGWIEKDIGIGSTIGLEYGTATVVGSQILQVGIRDLDCWELLTDYGGLYWYDKLSGLLISKDVAVPPYFKQKLMLLRTNVPTGFEHDLTVWLKAPPYLPIGTSTVLKATVYNSGLNNETNVRLLLEINGIVAASTVISNLSVASYHILTCAWSPTLAGAHNVTAYAIPVPNEIYTPNNVAQRTVSTISVQGTYLYVNPVETTVTMNQRLVVNITLMNVTRLRAWQVKLYYNPTLLNFTGAWVPSDSIFAQKPYVEGEPFTGVDKFGTYVLYGVALYPPAAYTGVNGSGSLCQLKFEALALGVSPLDIDTSGLGTFTTVLLNASSNKIAFTGLDGVTEVVDPAAVVHDIAVTNVVPSATYIVAGQVVNLTVTIENQGDVEETFNLTAYCGNTTIGTTTVRNMPSDFVKTITYDWNTSNVLSGVYTISASADLVPGEINLANNIYIYGKVTVTEIVRDVAVVAIEPERTWTYAGRLVKINVTVANEGEAMESFNVTLYYNSTCGALIGKQMVIGLSPVQNCTLAFEWNTAGVPIGRMYTLTAVASTVQGETNTADNIMDCPSRFHVRLVGDMNGDNIVDITDIAMVAGAFGSYPGHPAWNPACDITGDNIIDIADIAIVAGNFGHTCI